MSAPPPPVEGFLKLDILMQLTELRDVLLGTRKLPGPVRESLASEIDSTRRTLSSVTPTLEQYRSWRQILRENVSAFERQLSDDRLESSRYEQITRVLESLRTIRDEAEEAAANWE